MTDPGIATRYARALYEAARDRKQLDRVNEDMKTVAHLFEELPQVTAFCRREQKSREAEMELIGIAFLPYVGEMTGELLKALVRNGRITVLPDLPPAFTRVQDRYSDILRVRVESARQLDAETIGNIAKKMVARTGSTVEIEAKINSALMGGLRIDWDNMRIEMSAAHRVKQMKTWMKSI